MTTFLSQAARRALSVLGLTLCLSFTAHADKKIAGDLKLTSKPITSSELGDPGSLLSLKVVVQNGRDIDLPVRLIATKDRRLVVVPLARAYRNSEDQPTYEFELTSPIAELRYQFSLATSAQQAISTPLVEVRRSCLPNLTLVDPKADAPKDVGEKLKSLAVASRALELELDQYGSVMNQLTALKTLLPGGDS